MHHNPSDQQKRNLHRKQYISVEVKLGKTTKILKLFKYKKR